MHSLSNAGGAIHCKTQLILSDIKRDRQHKPADAGRKSLPVNFKIAQIYDDKGPFSFFFESSSFSQSVCHPAIWPLVHSTVRRFRDSGHVTPFVFCGLTDVCEVGRAQNVTHREIGGGGLPVVHSLSSVQVKRGCALEGGINESRGFAAQS